MNKKAAFFLLVAVAILGFAIFSEKRAKKGVYLVSPPLRRKTMPQWAR